MLSIKNKIIKRLFDFSFSFMGLLFLWPVILITWIIASLNTCSNGFFIQKRIGKNGKLFSVVKIKTMKPIKNLTTTVTSKNDPRITKIGKILRATKLDELPQLYNVLIGDMSFVGPRPDVPGFADRLTGEQRKILQMRPGITGPATLKYRNEEELLALQVDPEEYNRTVIFPDKVRINLEYFESWSLTKDLKCIYQTVVK